ncbi:MAG: 3-oxoacyl-[acyl-carrier-protein] synthase, KASII [uncultured Thermomicrobiales bacterium]|uniref:3-oxoacyl-[acyl-carrier-protein] synthase, KASII n=1 Tax=uncultured Thermomicrobiales bacterium TaxID=1645740 RepID=A0A6J4VDA8_9BACT|nr:MAG: 3-oxoacyl-[acyl-carrier-protein] synthase, KASII [uncultured Thermomicrobiales bacterium]
MSSIGSTSMAPRRVVVTGLGAITSLGPDVKSTWGRLVAGETGIVRIPDLDVDEYGCVLRGDIVDETEPRRFLSGKVRRTTSRFARLAVEAAGEALIDAGLVGDDLQPTASADLGLGGALLGTCLGGTYDDLLPAFEVFQSRGAGRVPPHLHVMFPHNLAAYTIQNRFGLGGTSSTVVTACSTGAQAIGDAYLAVRDGRAPLMVAGAVESNRHPFFIAGFAAMRALVTDSNDDPGAAVRPFDASRAGFVLGEGAGILILEDRERAESRGARIYAEIVGYATSNDAYHPIAPLPDGSGAVRAMRDAISDAGISPDDIGVVNAHAASTPAGDLAESVAIADVFGERASQIPVTSFKGAFGHCMGGSGAIETIGTILGMVEGVIAPTRNFREHDPDVPVQLDIVAGTARRVSQEWALKNAFGLGGQNASLVIHRAN